MRAAARRQLAHTPSNARSRSAAPGRARACAPAPAAPGPRQNQAGATGWFGREIGARHPAGPCVARRVWRGRCHPGGRAAAASSCGPLPSRRGALPSPLLHAAPRPPGRPLGSRHPTSAIHPPPSPNPPNTNTNTPAPHSPTPPPHTRTRARAPQRCVTPLSTRSRASWTRTGSYQTVGGARWVVGDGGGGWWWVYSGRWVVGGVGWG